MKNILITGTSSGLGLALAKKYLELGCQVYGFSRRPSVITNSNYHHASIDLTDSSAPQKYAELLKGVKKLDLVVLNAGVIGTISTMKASDLLELKTNMDINLWGNQVLLDCLFKQIEVVEQVIAISSGAAIHASVGWSGYALSKAALNMLVQLYAVEELNTHFTAFAPGLVDTPMQDYISSITDLDTFTGLERIQSARYSEAMPTANELSQRLPELFDKIKKYSPSGQFVDIRKISFEV